MPDIRIKRAYEPPERGDGVRILVDRLWPRGLRKDDAHFDQWRKDLSPTTALRQFYGHRPERFAEFAKRYRSELRRKDAVAAISEIVDVAQTASRHPPYRIARPEPLRSRGTRETRPRPVEQAGTMMDPRLTHAALQTRITKIRADAHDRDQSRLRRELDSLVSALGEHLAVETSRARRDCPEQRLVPSETGRSRSCRH